MHLRHVAVAALAVFTGACEFEVSSVEQALVACPNWACAQNNPTLNNRNFHELAEDGTANAEGFQLGPMVKDGVSYRVRVVGTRLTGYSRLNTISGAALVGAYFYVVDQGQHVLRVNINGIAAVPVWAGPKKGEMLESYRLEWSDPVADRIQNLCSTPPLEKPQGSELLGQKGDYTLVFENARYDAKAKTVLPGDRNWFNIGCAGHALSKLLLTGHHPLTGSAKVIEQQATLKMLVADYCGDGTPFTVGGEPLYWTSSNGYMPFFANPETLEARWNEHGAVCIGQPRLKTTKSTIAQQTFPSIDAAIDEQCAATRPPSCDDIDVNNFDSALVVSGNPINE